MGGVSEMSAVVGDHAHSFGLLRMTFGVGTEAKTKFVCIHASDPIDSGNFTQAQHARALTNMPALMKVIRSFAACATDIHIQSQEECTVEHAVGKLADVVRGVEAKLIDVENFNAAVQRHKEEHPKVQVLEEEKQGQMRYIESVQVPSAEAVQPECAGVVASEDSARLRKKVKSYSKGDMVEVWSSAHEQWLDGEVAQVAAESCATEEGLQIPAGSVMVVFFGGRLFAWFTPQLTETHLRPSLRPKAARPRVGNLLKETHGWFALRHTRYVELSKGFLRWWDTEESAKNSTASGMVYLLGLQQQRQGQDILLRTSGTQGLVYTFQAASEEDAEAWSQSLWEHAGFCQELREFSEAKAMGSKVKEELQQLVSRVSVVTMPCNDEEGCDMKLPADSTPAKDRASSRFGGACSLAVGGEISE